MKMTKRVLALLLACVLLIGVLPAYAGAAGTQPSIVFQPTSTAIEAGSTYNVEVYFQASDTEVSLAALELYFTYDPEQLSPAEFAFDINYNNNSLKRWSITEGKKLPV